MDKLKISTRLVMLIGLLSALLISIGSFGLWGIVQTNDSLRSVYEDRTIPVGQLADINRLNLRNRLLVANSFIFTDEIDKNILEMESNIASITRTWDAYMSTYLTPQEAQIAQQLAIDRKRFVQEGLLPAAAALRAKDMGQARQVVNDQIRPLYEPVRRSIEALIQLQLDVAKTEYQIASVRFERIRLMAISAIGLGVLLAGLWGWSLIAGISASLNEAVEVAEAVAHGDLTHTIKVSGRDEVARLLGALDTMQSGLRQVCSRVRSGSEGVATACAQIAAGNHDLSARTESQASALEQTAASMEELGAAVKQNADNARHANALAQTASQVAVKGGSVVAEVVSTMQGINVSSRKIADIINVIDGIAFQTNILALNAAVEAARAGDQGRGFAVVATEVRSLAGRSAQAAKEISALINDSVIRVEQGTALVDQAGATMDEVVLSIRHVTDIMGEISAASADQSAGVTQVGEAVTQMDQVTQQNAALVEEMAAAAASLQTQSSDLVDTVAVFRLSGQATPAPLAAPEPHQWKALPRAIARPAAVLT